MFGMKPKDALGALEDVTIFRNLSQATEDAVNATENERAFRMATAALRERASTIQRLQSELDQMRQKANVATIYGVAVVEAFNHALRDLSHATGAPEEELRKRYNTIRSQYFNCKANEGIEKKWFTHDPRLDIASLGWKWYVTGLDADHGF